MSETKQSRTIRENYVQQRLSRLKQTRKFILDNNLIGLLNNVKWNKLLEWIWCENILFEIKLLLKESSIRCDTIYELDSCSVLTDSSISFIEFLEIESITFPLHEKAEPFLIEHHIEYVLQDEKIRIDGYRYEC